MSQLGLLLAWTRVYVGVHFPLDMIGAAVAAFSAWLTFRVERRYVEHCYRLASRVHRRLSETLIAAGWLRG